MKMRILFLATFLCVTAPAVRAGATPAASQQQAMVYVPNTLGQALNDGVKYLREKGYDTVAFGVLTVFVISLMQKENPDFFATLVRGCEWPFFLVQRKVQYIFCNGQSLSWNEVASWHNRVSRVLTPLTKTTAVIDLSKERRLKSMDQEEDQSGAQDTQWLSQVAHIEKEFMFLKTVLLKRLHYYQDVLGKDGKKKKEFFIKTLGKKLVRTSLSRNEEIAFGITQAIVYLEETVTYCKSVKQFSALDKEQLKRHMNGICTTFEHIGVLVDEVTAADKNKKKLPMSADGTLTRAYTGGSSDSYGSYGYGSSYGN